MFEFIYQAQTWIFVAFVIISIILLSSWIAGKSVKEKRHKRKSPRFSTEESLSSYSSDSVSSCEDSVPFIPDEFKNRKVRPESVRKALDNPSKGELLCQEIAQNIYGVPFHRSVWPKWLKNPETGRPLELDLYNEKLKIAIEYHGRQHYDYVPHFHRNGRSDLASQKRRDAHKLDLCDENGVYLITVPYTVKDEDIEDWIRFWDPSAVKMREGRA